MATHMLSFANCLCFLMGLAVVFHTFYQDAKPRVFREVRDDLEVIYCKFPQSQSLEETNRCSSVHGLFYLLGNGCSFQEEPRGVAGDVQESIVIEGSTYDDYVGKEGGDGKEDQQTNKTDEEVSNFLVDSVVVIGLLLTGVSTTLDWSKEVQRIDAQIRGGLHRQEENGPFVARNRRFSLRDLRHKRRRDLHPKVARQASTGPSPGPRRGSTPAQFPEAIRRQPPQHQQSYSEGIPPSQRISLRFEDDPSSDRRRLRVIYHY